MLQPGALVIDLETKQVWGDVDHCGIEPLMESAKALMEAADVIPRGVWGLGKAYDGDCYVYTKSRAPLLPQRLPEAADGVFSRPPRWISLRGEKKIDSYKKLAGVLP